MVNIGLQWARLEVVALGQVVSQRICLDDTIGCFTNAAINYRSDTSNVNFTVFDAKNHATFSVAYFDAVSIPNIAQVGFNLGYMHDIRGANNRFNFVDKRVGEFNIDTAINFESIPFLPGNLNIGAGWTTTTTQST